MSDLSFLTLDDIADELKRRVDARPDMAFVLIATHDDEDDPSCSLTPVHRRGNINTCYGLARRASDLIRQEMDAATEDEDE